jgi:hypothetical protein
LKGVWDESAMLEISKAWPLAVRVILWVGLVVSTVTLPKFRRVVLTLSPEVPVPDRVMLVGVLLASLATLTPLDELTAPAAVGAKAT